MNLDQIIVAVAHEVNQAGTLFTVQVLEALLEFKEMKLEVIPVLENMIIDTRSELENRLNADLRRYERYAREYTNEVNELAKAQALVDKYKLLDGN